ncbi:MAG: signal peptide peptidase SppA [Acidobacteriota bacterium]
MVEQRKSGFRSALASVFRGVDLARRLVVNLIFLALLVLLVAWLGGDDSPSVPDSAALVIAPRGVLVEQLTGDAVDRAMAKLTGDEIVETLKQDLIRAIEGAKDDDRNKALYLDLGQMQGGGLDKLQEVRAAIDSFKESGKPVIAGGDFFAKSQYYLASAADEIYLHHMGVVLLEGYGRFRTYYKNGLDRAEINWNVFRIGEYKTAVEPYLFEGMSDAAREANEEWMGDLWDAYLADVAAARNLTPEGLKADIESFPQHLDEASGQAAQVALQLGLVDHVGGRDEVRDRLIELAGEDESTHSFHRIGYKAYLETLDEEDLGSGDSKVAVLVGRGPILGGSHAPGSIGGDSMSSLIRKARFDEDVKAIVLRVDSPGGSSHASELIRRELVLAREAGKKVVVSMASVAASGGYWISTASDEIWASPNTITGSIGIYSMFPTFETPMEKHLGARVDGIGTTWMAGLGRLDRKIDPRAADGMRLMIEQGYRDFLDRVSEARDMTVEEVDAIARGRVWSGADALELGLVDQLGGLQDAIASAAKLAQIGEDEEYRVEYLERELDFKDEMLRDLLSWASVWYKPEIRSGLRPRFETLVANFLREQAEMLNHFNDPYGIYAHCMCEVE